MKRNILGSAACVSTAMLLLASACSSGDEVCSPESGTICTIVGSGVAGLNGDGLHALDTALYLPQDVTEGPDQRLYVVDFNNHRVRVVTDENTIETVAGSGLLGDGPEGPALEAEFNHPTEVVFDPNGAMIIAAWHNSRLKRLNLATSYLDDICGTGDRAYAGDGGDAEESILDLPASVVFDDNGNTLIMDQANQVIRRVNANGIIETIAGQCLVSECADGEVPVQCPGANNKMGCGVEVDAELCNSPCIPSYAGDGGPATELRMAQPFGQAADPAGRMTLDDQGNLYFVDSRNNRIRRIGTDGIVTTVAGNGETGYGGDGGPAVDAQLNSPTDIEFASDGTLYIADTQNSCVRALSPDGIITTVAGICGQRGYEGDGGDPTAAILDRPYGIEVDRDDNLYVVDTYNHVVRLVLR